MKNTITILLSGLFLNCLTPALLATEIKQLTQKIELNLNGTARVSMQYTLDSPASGSLMLPFQFITGEEISFDNNHSSLVRIVDSNTVKYLSVPEGLLLGIANFTITVLIPDYYKPGLATNTEFGHITVKQKFVNTTAIIIRKLDMDMILPHDYVVNSVDESIPKLNANNHEAPYAIIEENGRHTVRLTAKDLKLGDNSMIALTIKHEKKSKVFMWLLFAVAVAYVVFFRDILKKTENKE